MREAIERRVRYPRLSRRRGIEGIVRVRFRILPGGRVESLSVISAAHEELGRAALAAVREAEPFSSPPGWVEVPVVFRLER